MGVCAVVNLKAKNQDTHLITMRRDRHIPSRVGNLAANCKLLQVLQQLFKRSHSPGDYVLGVVCHMLATPYKSIAYSRE